MKLIAELLNYLRTSRKKSLDIKLIECPPLHIQLVKHLVHERTPLIVRNYFLQLLGKYTDQIHLLLSYILYGLPLQPDQKKDF